LWGKINGEWLDAKPAAGAKALSLKSLAVGERQG
jgi:hypothetical protein